MIWRLRSLSLRRAWIEILAVVPVMPICVWSLSLRRAWIEIGFGFDLTIVEEVALLTESVD